jgi:hypothetical protein
MYYVFVEHKKTRSFNLCNFEELLECNRHYHKARQLNASIPSKTRNREGGEREREGGRERGERKRLRKKKWRRRYSQFSSTRKTHTSRQ